MHNGLDLFLLKCEAVYGELPLSPDLKKIIGSLLMNKRMNSDFNGFFFAF